MATPSRLAPSSPAGWALWAGPCLSACRLAPWVTSPSLPQDKGHRNLRTALQLTPQNPPTAFASGHPHWPSPFSAPFPPTSPAGLAVPGSDRNLGTQPRVSALDLDLRTAGPAPALPGSSCELGRGTAGPQPPPAPPPPPVLCCSHPSTRLGTHEGGRRGGRERGREGASPVTAARISVGAIDSFSSSWDPSGQASGQALDTEKSSEAPATGL